MKKIILILFVFLGNTIICKAQDTLGSFCYSGFTDSDLFFAKQYKKENIFYTIALNDRKVLITKSYVDSNFQETFETEFETSTREIRNAFLTDTSFIFLLRNKEKNANTLKYEFCFALDSFIKTPLQIDAFTNNTTVAQNIVNNEMYFYQINNKTKKIIFTLKDCNNQGRIYEFSIDEVVKQTGLKKGKFETAFFNEKTVLTYENDRNLFNLSSAFKCYIRDTEAFIISNVLDRNITNVLHFNFINNTANYFTLNTSQMSCEAKSHFTVRRSFALYHNYILCTKSCIHNIELSFFNYNGGFIKSYSIDSSYKNAVSNYGAYKVNYRQDTTVELNEIKKDILNKTDYTASFHNYTTCYPVDENNFMVVTGYYKERGPSAGAILLSSAFAALSFAYFHIDIPQGYYTTRIFFIPSTTLFDGNSKHINKANYVITTFNNTTLQESTTIPTNFYTSQQKAKTKNENTITSFIYNGSTYNVLFSKAGEQNQLLIVKDKLH